MGIFFDDVITTTKNMGFSDIIEADDDVAMRKRVKDGRYMPEKFMIMAIQKSAVKIIRLLIDKGADVHSDFLTEAASFGHEDVIRLLMEYMGNLGFAGVYALSAAVSNNHLGTAKILVDAGVNIDHHKLTLAVANAIASDYHDVAYFMIESGVRVTDRLMVYAAAAGNEQMIRYIVSKGANPSVSLLTPVRHLKVDTIRILLECGAVPTDREWNLLRHDVSVGAKKIIHLFVHHGHMADFVNPYEYIGVMDARHLRYLDRYDEMRRIIKHRDGMRKRMLSYPSDVDLV